jgi:hypothetical protein
MLHRRKLRLVVAAITAALALAVPVVSASAATTPGAQSTLCVLLHQQVAFAGQTGNPTLASLLNSVLVLMHC